MKKSFFEKIILTIFFVAILIGCNYKTVFASDEVPQLQPYASINSEGDVTAARFSPDGKYIATGYAGGKLTLWNSSTLEKMFSTTATDGREKLGDVVGIRFSSDGKLIAVYDNAYDKNKIFILDSSNGKFLNKISIPNDSNDESDSVYDIAFSPDGKTLYSCVKANIGKLVFSDVQTGSTLKSLTFNTVPNCIAYNTSNDTIAVGLSNGLIVIKDAKTGAQIKNIDTKNVYGRGPDYLQYDLENKVLLYGVEGEKDKFLEVDNNYSEKFINDNPNTFNRWSTFSRISPDDNFLLRNDLGSYIYLYDFKTGNALCYIGDGCFNNCSTNQVDLDKNSNILIIGSDLYDLSSIQRKKLVRVKINADKTTLNYNDKANISLTGYYDDGTSEQISYADANWSTSDFNTVIVNNGTIIARGSGKATISVDYKGLKDNLDINVLPNDATEYKVLETKYDEPVDKTFEVTFNTKMDISTIKEQNIYVTDSQGNIVPMFYYCNQGFENKISIIPVKNYVSGQTYTLWIKNIKSTDGRVLKQNTKMSFTIK